MKLKFTTLLILAAFSAPAMADKPEWAGAKKGPTAEQLDEHRDAMRAKRGPNDDDYDRDYDHDKKQYKKEQHRQNHQYEQGSDLERDINRSAEMVEETREMGRRWWKFWGE